jgi:hypothetical protein
MVIQQELDSWTKFRRGLRREDQEALDDLFRAARLQLAGSAYAARPIPFESIAMSMLLAQHRTILRLERLTHQLAERVQTLEGGSHDGGNAIGAGTAGPGDAPDHRMAV